MNKRPPFGFSLVEFMISIALGTLLVAAAIFVFISVRSLHKTEASLGRIQENARFISFLMTKDIRMAGYSGCRNSQNIHIENLIASPPAQLSTIKLMQGHDSHGTGFLPALPVNILTADPHSDVLEIQMASPIGMLLTETMNNPADSLHVDNRLGMTENTYALITDCLSGDLFETTSGTSTTLINHASDKNNSERLSSAYTTTAKVMPYFYYAYFVKDSGRVTRLGAPIMVLVRQDINGNELEIAEGVKSMKISYGIGSGGNVERYATAEEITNTNAWNQIVCVEISLILESPEDALITREWKLNITLRNQGALL